MCNLRYICLLHPRQNKVKKKKKDWDDDSNDEKKEAEEETCLTTVSIRCTRNSD